jgi:hypothetical protein
MTNKKSFSQLCDLAKALTNDSDEDDISQVYFGARDSDLSSANIEKLLKIVAGRIRVSIPAVRADYKTLRVAAKKDRGAGKAAAAAQRAIDAGKTPIFVADDDFDDVAREAWGTIVNESRAGEFLFQHGSDLARLDIDATTGRCTVTDLSPARFRATLAERMVWLESAGDDDYRGVTPPRDVAEVMFHGKRPAELAKLLAVHHSPFFIRDADGTPILIDKPGYHESGHYYDPVGLNLAPVPANPSDSDVRDALALIFDAFGDFPFDDGKGRTHASKAHLLALLLHFFVRPLIDGPTPIFGVTKTKPRTGAGLLLSSTFLIGTGEAGKPQPKAKDDDELRKTVVAVLRSGAPYLWLDNLHGTLDSSTLAALSTATVWRDRLLGSSDAPEFPVDLALIVTGNQLRVSNEIAQRMVPIRLDARGDPTKRTGFRHKQLLHYVTATRSALVHAVLTLVARWIADGSPAYRGKALEGFEAWSSVIGGILASTGVPGFLSNLEIMREGGNEEDSAKRAFVSAWLEQDGFGKKRSIGDPDDAKSGSLVTLIDDETIAIPLTGHTGPDRARSLAAVLRGMEDESFVIDDIKSFSGDVFVRIERSAKGHSYWLEAGDRAGALVDQRTMRLEQFPAFVSGMLEFLEWVDRAPDGEGG